MIYVIFNVVLRFFDSRYRVSDRWESNCSDALPTELASLTQGYTHTYTHTHTHTHTDIYTDIHIYIYIYTFII